MERSAVMPMRPSRSQEQEIRSHHDEDEENDDVSELYVMFTVCVGAGGLSLRCSSPGEEVTW